jgi:hypothetical protein
MNNLDLNEIIDTFEHRQHAMFDATRKWAEDLSTTLADGTPISGEVRNIVDAAFEFSVTIADSAREFAKSVMKAVAGQGAERAAPEQIPKPRKASAARTRKASAARSA